MVLKRVDPMAPRSPLQKGLTAFGRTGVGRAYGIRFASRVDPFLLRHTGGRVRTVGSLPTALLGSTGARSGTRRENPIVYFHDAGAVIVVASSFGRERNPGWYYNLLADPACTLNGEAYVAAEVDDEGERARLYALATRVYAGYADYKVRTDATGRRIPILRLTPVG